MAVLAILIAVYAIAALTVAIVRPPFLQQRFLTMPLAAALHLAALVLATMSQGGLPTHIGFGLLAVLWLGTTATAYRHIRAGQQVAHRRWMTRSYALTFAAVTLRIYLPLSFAVGLPFEPAYQAISWLCWVPNLIVAEWFILPRMAT